MGRPHKPKGPPKRGGKIDYPDLFEWVESAAARVAALVGDVSAVSLTASPAAFALFLGLWLGSSEDHALRPVLAVATTVALVCTCLAWFTRAGRSYVSHNIAIVLHGFAVVGVGLVMFLIVFAGWYQDSVGSSARKEAAVNARADEEAAHAAAAEVQRQSAKAQEAAARAIAAKDEAVREAERVAARLAEAECQRARDDAIDKATRAYESARRGAEDCRARYNEQLISLKRESEYCKAPFLRLDSARWQLGQAKGKTCDEMSTGTIDKLKK